MAPTTQELSHWIGMQLNGPQGSKIGKIDDIYVDDMSGRPEWLAVTTGLFGTKRSFVPLADARLDGDHVAVPYTKDQVKDAPNAEHDGHLSPAEEARLYEHYGIDYAEAPPASDDEATPTRSEAPPNARLRRWADGEAVEAPREQGATP